MDDRLIRCCYELEGEGVRTEAEIDSIVNKDDTVCYSAGISAGGYSFIMEYSVCERSDITGLRIRCHIKGTPAGKKKDKNAGIRLSLALPIDAPAGCKWRFCTPSIDLSSPRRFSYKKRVLQQDEEALGNIFGMYNCDKQVMYSIYRSSTLNDGIEVPHTMVPKNHDSSQMAALGYEVVEKDRFNLLLSWPRTTGYYPLDGRKIDIVLDYSAYKTKAATYADGIFDAYRHLTDEVLDLSEDSMRSERLELLKKAQAGFGALYRNYEGMPEGFCSDNEIMGFGMKERNVKIASFMAVTAQGKWVGVLDRISSFYSNRCVTSSGFAYTKFDRSKDEPVKDFEGNYLLAMCQGMHDIFIAYKVLKKNGMARPALLEQSRKFADYLVRIQNSDGSWYHAYDENGNDAEAPVKEKLSFEKLQGTKKSGSEAPLCYIARIALYLEKMGLHADEYRESAVKCAEFVLKNIVRFEMYLGGDPAYPSAPQMDAVKYTLMGLYNTYELTHEEKYLKGAVTAAKLFVVGNTKYTPCECIELYKLGLLTGEKYFTYATYFAYMDVDLEII
ncbi:MAG: hypothetical protein IK139_06560 [Lachnospiraceae bacterium]|nr:hypothetical protein [Lachnospiraceae bacterium]